MPSKSKAQARLMAAAAHNPAFAKKVGIPVSVAQEFNQADKGKKFKEGGMALFKGKETAGEEKAEARALRSGKISKEQYIKGEKSEGKKEPMSEIKKNARDIKSGKLSPAKYAAEEGKEYCGGGKVKKMAFGGLSGALSNATNTATNAIANTRATPVGLGALGNGPGRSRPVMRGQGLGALGKGGPGVGGMAMKKGGSVRGCGIAQRGKTKGKMV